MEAERPYRIRNARALKDAHIESAKCVVRNRGSTARAPSEHAPRAWAVCAARRRRETPPPRFRPPHMPESKRNERRRSANNDTIDLAELASTLERHRWLAIGIAAVVAASSLLFSSTRTPVYKTTATLKLEQEGRGTGVLSDLAALTSAPAAEGEMSILRSRTMVEATVAPPEEWKHHERAFTAAQADEFRMEGPVRLGLTTRVESDSHRPLNDLLRLFGGRDHPAQRLFASIEPLAASNAAAPARIRVAFPEAAHGTRVRLSVPTRRGLPDRDECEFDYRPGARIEYQGRSLRLEALGEFAGAQYTLEYRPLDATVDEYLGKVDVEETSRNSGVIRLTVSDSDPERAAEFANALCHNYLLRSIRLGRSRATRTIEFVDEQLTEQKRLLEEAEAEVVALQQRNPAVILVSASAESLLKQLAEIDAERTRRALARVALGEAAELLDRGENDALSRLSRELPDLVSMSYIEMNPRPPGRRGARPAAQRRRTDEIGPAAESRRARARGTRSARTPVRARVGPERAARRRRRGARPAARAGSRSRGARSDHQPVLERARARGVRDLRPLRRVDARESALQRARRRARRSRAQDHAALDESLRGLAARRGRSHRVARLLPIDARVVAGRGARAHRNGAERAHAARRAQPARAHREPGERGTRARTRRREPRSETRRAARERTRGRRAPAPPRGALAGRQAPARQPAAGAAQRRGHAALRDPHRPRRAAGVAPRTAPLLRFPARLRGRIGPGRARELRAPGAVRCDPHASRSRRGDEPAGLRLDPRFPPRPDAHPHATRGLPPAARRSRRSDLRGVSIRAREPALRQRELDAREQRTLAHARLHVVRAGRGQEHHERQPRDGLRRSRPARAARRRRHAQADGAQLLRSADGTRPRRSAREPRRVARVRAAERTRRPRSALRRRSADVAERAPAQRSDAAPDRRVARELRPRALRPAARARRRRRRDPGARARRARPRLPRRRGAPRGARREVAQARPRRRRARVAGAVVNAARPSRSGASPYYGGYHYGYGKERGGKRRTKLERVG